MKINLVKYAIIGIILVVLCIIFVRSCTITDRYSRLLGEYTALKSIAKENEKIAQDNIDKSLKQIKNLTSKNAELTKHVKLKENELVNLDNEVNRLETELIDAQNTGDKDAQITNLESQVTIWKEKFTLAQNIITDKDSIIFNLTNQYKIQLNVSNEYKTLYENELNLRIKCEVLLKATTRKLHTAKGVGTFKSIFIGALGGYVAYQLIKGTK